MSEFDGVQLSLFSHRLSAVCDEMGSILKRAAFSPNIKDRLDYSCAIFDAQGGLCAQAAHIPVHLGSMAYAMAGIIDRLEWQPGDMVIVNDPYLGGTHLPDVTLIQPVYHEDTLMAFVVNRAHHANIGSETPGSMPISRTLEEEGLVIEPALLIRHEIYQQPLWSKLQNLSSDKSGGDFIAQVSANHAGAERLLELIKNSDFTVMLAALNDYGERIALSTLQAIPDGEFQFTDYMDDDGQGNRDIKIQLKLIISNDNVTADFTGTSSQVDGNINCPISVAAAAVYYVIRCLLPDYTPNCSGVFKPIHIVAPQGCLLNASRPHAVAAGNVETSTRIVDVILGALAQVIPESIPAASYGSMNNVAIGNARGGWSYYETVGGGSGAHQSGAGLNAIQCHMTNTLNTPIESLEMHYPMRVTRYQVREGSGGKGVYNGGDGILREYQLLEPATITLLTERRLKKPWGLQGGSSGESGVNLLNGSELPPKCEKNLHGGDILTIKTPGGGGWGRVD